MNLVFISGIEELFIAVKRQEIPSHLFDICHMLGKSPKKISKLLNTVIDIFSVALSLSPSSEPQMLAAERHEENGKSHA